jgi:hypothetical protein
MTLRVMIWCARIDKLRISVPKNINRRYALEIECT